MEIGNSTVKSIGAFAGTWPEGGFCATTYAPGITIPCAQLMLPVFRGTAASRALA